MDWHSRGYGIDLGSASTAVCTSLGTVALDEHSVKVLSANAAIRAPILVGLAARELTGRTLLGRPSGGSTTP